MSDGRVRALLDQADREFGAGALRMLGTCAEVDRAVAMPSGVRGLDRLLGGGLVHGQLTVVFCEDDVARGALVRWVQRRLLAQGYEVMLARMLPPRGVPGEADPHAVLDPLARFLKEVRDGAAQQPRVAMVDAQAHCSAMEFERLRNAARQGAKHVLVFVHTGVVGRERLVMQLADAYLVVASYGACAIYEVEAAKSRSGQVYGKFYLEAVDGWKSWQEVELEEQR